MKILQISNYYYPHIGGIEQTSKDIADSLKGKHEVKVFCFNHKDEDCSSMVDGVEIVRAGSFAKVASQSLSRTYSSRLKKIFCRFQPDVVIFHYPNPFAAHYLIKILKKHPECKLVLWWHLDITKQKFLRIFFEGQSKWLLSRACKVVATSPNYISGSNMLKSVGDKCVVVPSCVGRGRVNLSDGIISHANQLKKSAGGKVICFAVGRHVEYKGMEYLIRASKFLDDGYQFWIGGNGPLTNELKKLAADDKKVVFLGVISDEELESRLFACDIFCFPSITKNEAFGLALAEAMAYGKPCVTFTIPGSGVNYVSLNGVTGIEVENGNAEKFAAAIKTLGEDAALRKQYGDNAKDRAARLFSFIKFKENILKLLDDLQEHVQ